MFKKSNTPGDKTLKQENPGNASKEANTANKAAPESPKADAPAKDAKTS